MTSTASRGPFERLARHAVVYSAGDICVRAAAFLLIPLFTRRLTIAEFGVLGLVQLVDALLVMFLNLGMSTAILRRVAGARDPEWQADVFSGLVTIVVWSAVVGAACFASGQLLNRAIFGGALDSVLIAAVLVNGAFGAWKLFVLSLIRAEGRAVRYLVVNVGHFALLMLSSLTFVAWLGLGLRGAIFAQALASGAAFAALLPFLMARAHPRWHASAVRELLRYGLPLMPGMVAMTLITMSNRVFLQHMRDAADVGIYTLAFRIALPLQIAFVAPFRTAWLPVLFSLGKREEVDRVASLALCYFLAAAGLAGLFLSLFAPDLIRLISTERYAESAPIVPLLVLGFLLNGIYFIVDGGVLRAGKTHVYPWIVGGAAVVNLALNYSFIGRWGVLGAAWATVASYGLLTIAMYSASQRVYPISYAFRRAAIPGALAVGLFGLAASVPALREQMLARWALLAAYPLALYVLGFFREPERRRLSELMRRRA